jgi:hydroxymethylpyrimidine kinase/phosphomethylpyrimidine kinase/thiamine-phosphate diphosphorylase
MMGGARRFPVRPIVLTIAGSDPSGGAGIQADVKAVEAGGGYAAAAITAITVQDTRGVRRVSALAPDLVREQIDAVLSDLDVAAVKCGMLAGPAIVSEVATCLRRHAARNVVVDPVLRSHEGTPLLDADAIGVLGAELLPLTRIVTPNVAEAEVLGGVRIRDLDDAVRGGRRILELGCEAVLVTGGHLEAGRGSDVLVDAAGARVFAGRLVETLHTHGGGCTYASAIATGLAHGLAPAAAVERAKRFIGGALRHSLAPGRGTGPVDAFHFLHHGAAGGIDPGRLHVLTDECAQSRFTHGDLAFLAAAGGADVIQFREKRDWSEARRVETARAMVRRLEGTAARLVVNDGVEVAAACGAAGVHLGPRDADPRAARVRLGPAATVGVTVNDPQRLQSVRHRGATYYGVGPVFGTRSKAAPAPALGIEGLARIVAAADRPVIAIGGLTPERVSEVLDAGASGVAVLSDVVCSADPAERVRRFVEALARASNAVRA